MKMNELHVNNSIYTWTVDLNDPSTIPALCYQLQDYLAPPDEAKTECMVYSLKTVINKLFIERNEPIPESLRRRLTIFNERLNILRYSAFPREWTL